MAVTHTLPDNVLTAYATGTLPAAFDLVVAAHLSLCDDARARLESFDALGGAVLERGAAVPVSEDCLCATLSQIDGCAQEPVALPDRDATFPAPLRQVLGDRAVPWRNIGMGARQAVVHREAGATARLLHIPAGSQVPDHGHGGMELTLVLQGAFRDEFGEYHRGDIELADEDVDHTPVVLDDGDCICLVATDGLLRFRGLLPRLAQPFIGL